MLEEHKTVKINKKLFSYQIETGVGELLYKRLSFHEIERFVKELTFACKEFKTEKLVVLWAVFLIICSEVEFILKASTAQTSHQI